MANDRRLGDLPRRVCELLVAEHVHDVVLAVAGPSVGRLEQYVDVGDLAFVDVNLADWCSACLRVRRVLTAVVPVCHSLSPSCAKGQQRAGGLRRLDATSCLLSYLAHGAAERPAGRNLR